ncbi:fructosamine kinase family protein [Myxacorys almedinensis]|uniref:Phosphotransferase n=1 Tax=Myxacorys almedinensis A TaxID=2690445 RepID=A0A8J7YXY8_9CYAN|nr:fructosamine kinase family protein [Myxacorys almedinensis]NDJ16604.1 phosphotransferase [Myxacorys almedinensis A]
MWSSIDTQISQAIAQPFESRDRRAVGGGCINQGYRVSDGDRTFFIKLNRADQLAMFEAEALGLQHLREANAILVPQPICWGVAEDSSYLVQTWLELGQASSPAWEEMGRQLGRLHHVQKATAFGWERNNTIGSTPQHNPWTLSWSEFFTHHRIGYQLQLAQQRGGRFPNCDRLLAAVPELLAGHAPKPSLVHGDLWSGNAAVTTSGQPVIFDPATYWGDREVDLAMTELFGGFPPAFYQGYNAVFPVNTGYSQRKVLYNLYHVLNHFNLFGGGYAAQADRMIGQLLLNVRSM